MRARPRSHPSPEPPEVGVVIIEDELWPSVGGNELSEQKKKRVEEEEPQELKEIEGLLSPIYTIAI